MKSLAHIFKAGTATLRDLAIPIESQWTDPAPFPQGKHGYPTRIAYSVTLNSGSKGLRYMGKPTRQAVSVVYDAMRRRDCAEVLITEFDRKNLVAEYFNVGRSAGVTHMTRGNLALLRLYHPFDYQGGTAVIPYFLNKFYIKRLTLGAQKYVYYSPFERLKIKTQIDPFRLWIAEQRRLPAAQPEKAPPKLTLNDIDYDYRFFDPGPREDMP